MELFYDNSDLIFLKQVLVTEVTIILYEVTQTQYEVTQTQKKVVLVTMVNE